MKKLLSVFVVVLLACSFVIAEQSNNSQNMGEDAQGEMQGEGEQVTEQNQGEENLIMNQEGDQKGDAIRSRSQFHGLDNALSKVTNEQARERLNQNLQDFEARYEQRMARMEGLEITEVDEETGAVKLQAQQQVKYFGFIKGQALHRYEVNANGEINENAPWYRFMYKVVEE